MEHGNRSEIKYYRKKKKAIVVLAFQKSDMVISYFIKQGPSDFNSE